MARSRPPKYCRQKRKDGPDLAYVEINGRRRYLGKYDAPESWETYHRLMAELSATGGVMRPPPEDITVTELLAAYWQSIDRYCRKPNGDPTSDLYVVKIVIRRVKKFYGGTLASDFGPKSIRVIRQSWIDASDSGRPLSRQTVNQYTAAVKTIFRWGVSHELIPGSIYHALQTVEGLQWGKSEARETEPVCPVPDADINAIQPYVGRQVWALIQLQLLTGARPGELLKLRAIDFDTSGTVWTYLPLAHKTAHHGHKRKIYFGPKAQEVIQPFMVSHAVDVCLFSPREAEKERKAKGLPNMKGRQQPNPQSPNQKRPPNKTNRTVGAYYTTDSYRQAVERGCELANVSRWFPNRLRHNAATMLRREHGIDIAQTILGHQLGSSITEVYAEANTLKAVEVMLKVG